MNNDTYNGYSNYATWRVHLEFFAKMDARDTFDQIAGMSLHEIAAHAKETARKFIYGTLPNHTDRGQTAGAEIVTGWAAAFLDEVDWKEIAEYLAEAAGIEPRK